MPDKSHREDRICFIICPLGTVDSEERKISDDLRDNVIKPALSACKYKAIRIDELVGLDGSITTEIKEEIKSADLVIADLRGLNANVMFELGYRHAINKRCILLVDHDTEVPFNIHQYQHFEYYVENNECIDGESKIKMINYISKAIKSIENTRKKNPLHSVEQPTLIAEQPTLIEEFHQGRDLHYEKSLGLLQDNSSNIITRIFMLQRSSTFILGPKFDSGNEFILHIRLGKLIKEQDIKFYHVFSLDGLKKDLFEEGIPKKYTNIDTALNNLAKIGDKEFVGLVGFNCNSHIFRQLRRQYDVDNQVRFFIVEREDVESEEKTCKAIVVFKYGDSNCSLIISGPIASTLLEHGVILYEQSELLTWSELDNTIKESRK
jgi:nucleoside 2-deoxyribosyltransferase